MLFFSPLLAARRRKRSEFSAMPTLTRRPVFIHHSSHLIKHERKVKKGLISNGWFKYCRNTNYLGEMMIYGTYAILSQDAISWCILIYAWTLLFGKNILNKEGSFIRKKGGKEYVQNSGMIIPWGNFFGGDDKDD